MRTTPPPLNTVPPSSMSIWLPTAPAPTFRPAMVTMEPAPLTLSRLLLAPGVEFGASVSPPPTLKCPPPWTRMELPLPVDSPIVTSVANTVPLLVTTNRLPLPPLPTTMEEMLLHTEPVPVTTTRLLLAAACTPIRLMPEDWTYPPSSTVIWLLTEPLPTVIGPELVTSEPFPVTFSRLLLLPVIPEVPRITPPPT